jgi:threonine dehydrogenase-like Zn-dependent dehydrogenase
VCQVSKQRRAFAKEFGAHHVIDPTSGDIVKQVKELTKGYGADVGFDAAGVQIAVDYAVKAVRARGTLVNIALWGAKRVALDMMDMIFGERKYQAGKSRLGRANG